MPSIEGDKRETSNSPQNGEGYEDPEIQTAPTSYLTGWRFYGTVVGVYLGIFLATMEVSIVSTALVAITDDLGDFGQSTWLVTSYLLTYTGFLIILAQFSDVLGRKLFVALAVIMFMIFSAACAGAQTFTQLIILRVFQGIGGAGMYNMTMVILAEAVPPEQFPKYVSLVAAVTALAFAIGPLVGGAITNSTTWRWVFWINLPIGFLALLTDLISIPNSFPHHNTPSQQSKLTLYSLKQLDIIGALTFLSLSISFVAAIQEANVSYAWKSGVVIALLILSGLSLFFFTYWERFLTLNHTSIVPVLSWNLATRKSLGLFMVSFLIGAPFTCAAIQIPQRFQTINSLSPLGAGTRLLAFILMVPFGAVLGAGVAEKFKIKPTYSLLFGTALQLIGAACFTTLPHSREIRSSQYGFQVIFGVGNGISNSIGTTSVPLIVARKDIPSALGANTQFRYLGGAIGLGIITSVLNAHLRPVLASILSPQDLVSILRSTEIIKTLPSSQKEEVLRAFADGFDLQWKVILAFICAQVPAALLMW